MTFKGTKKPKTLVVSYWEFDKCLITSSAIESLKKLVKIPFGTIGTEIFLKIWLPVTCLVMYQVRGRQTGGSLSQSSCADNIP